MDKQTISIPVNTRTVGDAKHIFEGIYVLYLEDYVHTFIKKLLYEQEFDNALEAAIIMYGSSFEKESQNIMIVSGAVVLDDADKDYFADETRLCSAAVMLNKNRGVRFEISTKGTKVILDDFYIYYDQNEQMQNYLIEWNSRRHEQQMKRMPRRAQTDNAAKLGRLVQAYNRESARVSLVWGAMNVLSLSLVACVIAYGIISINSYAKMKNMQENIDYCMAFVLENMEKLEEAAALEKEDAQNVMNVWETQIDADMEAETEAQTETQSQTQTAAETESDSGTDAEQIDDASAKNVQEDKDGKLAAQSAQDGQAVHSINTQTPQYYVVQRGDTLGKICIAIYGDSSMIKKICELNGIENPDNILYGQKLLLP